MIEVQIPFPIWFDAKGFICLKTQSGNYVRQDGTPGVGPFQEVNAGDTVELPVGNPNDWKGTIYGLKP